MTKEEKREYNRQYYLRNKAKLCSKQNEYRVNNIDRIKNYREENKDKINEYQRQYREENKETFSKYEKKRYSDERKEQIKKYHTSEKGKVQRRKTRKKSIYDTWRSLLHSSLKRMNKTKGSNSIDLLDYSATELKEHLENQFTDGMTWDNHGEWHIDHIKPVSSFDEDTPPSVVNALSNLQPLWAYDNLIKSNNIE